MNEQLLKNRKLKVDLATSSGGGMRDGRGGRMGGRYGGDPEDDRTLGDWRSGPPPEPRGGDRDERYRDRGEHYGQGGVWRGEGGERRHACTMVFLCTYIHRSCTSCSCLVTTGGDMNGRYGRYDYYDRRGGKVRYYILLDMVLPATQLC